MHGLEARGCMIVYKYDIIRVKHYWNIIFHFDFPGSNDEYKLNKNTIV